MPPNAAPSFTQVAYKTVVMHTVTYFAAGLLALWLLDYRELFASPGLAGFMRQTDDPIVMAGPLFQPLRGLVFALAIYPLREVFFYRPRGWLLLWWLFLALGVLSTFGPAPGSIEGLIYTVTPAPRQLLGLVEVVTQTFLLAFGVVYWINHPEKRWLSRVMMVAFVLVLVLPIVGLLATSHRV